MITSTSTTANIITQFQILSAPLPSLGKSDRDTRTDGLLNE